MSRVPLEPLSLNESFEAVAKFNEENEALHSHVKHKQEIIDALSAEAAGLQQQNLDLKEKLRILKSRNRALEAQKQKVEVQRRESEFYKVLLAQKDQQIARLSEADLGRREFEQQEDRLKALLQDKEAQVLDLIGTVNDRDQELLRLRARVTELEESEEQAARLRVKVGELDKELAEKEQMGIELLAEFNRKSKALREESESVREIMKVYEAAKQEIAFLKKQLARW